MKEEITVEKSGEMFLAAIGKNRLVEATTLPLIRHVKRGAQPRPMNVHGWSEQAFRRPSEFLKRFRDLEWLDVSKAHTLFSLIRRHELLLFLVP